MNRSPVASLRASALSMLTLGVLVQGATAQTDRINDTPVGWTYNYGATSANIDASIASGFRPFNITPTGGNYDVITVQNTGEYAAGGADAYWSSSTTSIASALASANKRILDLEVVNALTGTWSAVVVNNSGSTAAPGWDWATGLTLQGMINWQAANGLRPIDVDQYATIAGTRYSIVAVPNTGNNHQSGWWWYFGVSEAQVTNALTSNGARLIDIDVASTSPLTFNAVMVSENPGLGVWHPGLTSSQVTTFVNQNGVRLTCLQRYTDSGGTTKFAVAGVDNVNAQTRRMRAYFDSLATTGNWGFKLKQVGGPTLASLNEDFEFHPASMIKILYGTYAIDRCAANLDSLGSDCLTPVSCANSCPDSGGCAQATQTLENALRGMLVNSDNFDTKAVENRYGRATLNAYADNTLNLNSVQVNTTIGCFCVTSTTANDMTCRDGVSIYEQIANGSLFSQPWQDTLYEIMINLDSNSGWSNYPTLSSIITQEASATDLTSGEVADFRTLVKFAHKAGGSTCDATGLSYSTVGGWASLPFKVYSGPVLGYLTIPREYALTLFHTDYVNTPADSIPSTAREEILREQVREALQSWDAACSTPVINNQPDPTSVTEGQNATFSTSIGIGVGPRSFRWWRLIGSTWNAIFDAPGQFAGADTLTLTVLNATEADEHPYRCVISSGCGNVTSNSVQLTVNPPTGCDPIDFNHDSLFPDTADIDDFLAVFAGQACPSTGTACNTDIDFNNDGLFPDTLDIDAFLSVFAGGACL